jgi:hypothetical protein
MIFQHCVRQEPFAMRETVRRRNSETHQLQSLSDDETIRIGILRRCRGGRASRLYDDSCSARDQEEHGLPLTGDLTVVEVYRDHRVRTEPSRLGTQLV